MLSKLIIKNIALIDSAEICFKKGLNVLSGETGAGKSVIIESLNFVLGAKADKSLIRSGQTECSVIAEFDVSENLPVKDVYNEFDFDNDDILLISRKFTIDGKSSIKINGNSATVSMLRKFTSILVDVHGQSEHFNLLKTSNQLALLDKFGGQSISDIKQVLNEKFSVYKHIIKELEDLGGDESQRLIRLDVLNFQINEISNANLEEGEDEKLLLIKQKLANQEKIVMALRGVSEGISSEGGVEDIIANVNRIMASISDFDKEYSILYDRIESLYAEINDISSTANNLLDNLDVSEYNPYEIESRLDLIKSLKNKYGGSIKSVSEYLIDAIAEKDKLENYAQKALVLGQEKAKVSKEIFELYNKLSNIRKENAKIFENNIRLELTELGMKKSNFEVFFADLPNFEQCKFVSANGIDEIDFLFSANLGEPLKNLSMVISGGEMSRFMLAIKAQTAKYNDVSTFIFDEIDSGISGNVAKIVAEKFAKIALSTQIIAITHLPQISAMADNNLLIEKNEDGEKTLTSVKTLTYEQKINEIVRLVGGEQGSQTAIKLASDLIENAKLYKKSLINL